MSGPREPVSGGWLLERGSGLVRPPVRDMLCLICGAPSEAVQGSPAEVRQWATGHAARYGHHDYLETARVILRATFVSSGARRRGDR
ncbi:hypothetical protein GCM10018793_44320 [Streptomyces sulfonofaciens]|uniref:DUF7848 domain-containing protein n=1 Tax=Streptomyces sulfonofaciens TaxID=68272 RepID=A0A919GDX2_9ACTN|nr:hypothetical protein GCM10018793_44320 [Streptomyces sulfonofaciens]